MSDMSDIERWFAYGDENGDGPCNDDVDPDYEVGICQNCDVQLTLQQARRGTLYCSEKCQQTAEIVRYGRATLRDGRYERDPENLQALCSSCNDTKAAANFRPATPEKAAEGKAIWTRITAERPVRLCDDEKRWDELRKEIASEQQTWALWWSDRASEAEGNR